MLSTSRPGRTAVLLPLMIVALLVLVVFLDARRRQVEAQLQELTLATGQFSEDQQANRQRAEEIVAMVRQHIDIPADIEPTVATIVDVETLRQQNSFYEKAENGDYLVVTETRAILFDAETQRILDVVPVQLERDAQPESEAAAQ